MGLKGILGGGLLGALFGGPLGALFGGVLGDRVEKTIMRGREARKRAAMFCDYAAAMLAKMAKADGRVTEHEIAGVERAFQRLGFSPEARQRAIQVFRRAKDDQRTIYDYAQAFARAVNSVGVRELFYEILWEIAAADGTISANEQVILQRIPRVLAIRIEWYGYFFSKYAGGNPEPQDALAAAYQLLGAQPEDSDDALKRRYRELAKKNHPDVLRAQGLPEAMVSRATERMSRINSAWAQIRSARGI